jgi:hypothetical protein
MERTMLEACFRASVFLFGLYVLVVVLLWLAPWVGS